METVSCLYYIVSTKASATYFFCTAQYTSPRPRHTFVLYPSPPLTLPLPSPSVHSSSPSPCPLLQVSLALLTLHEDSLLQCDSMESISEYIKEDIPDTELDHLPYILSYSLKVSPEFSLKLKGFEAEYHVLHNLSSSPGKGEGSLEETVEEVKKQNRELIEVVVALRGAITRLEAQVQLQQEKELRQDKLIEM